METSSCIKGPAGCVSSTISELLLPDVALSSCLFGAFVRDTRGCDLNFEQRFNHYAASPLCAISWIFAGECHLLDDRRQMDDPNQAPLLDRIVVSGPQRGPRTSWNPGDTHAMILTFYPEAFYALTGLYPGDHFDENRPADQVLSGDLLDLVSAVLDTGDATRGFRLICEALKPIWHKARPEMLPFGNLVTDWRQSLATRAFLSGIGRSTRQIERRVRSWTGQSMRSLKHYSRSDETFQRALLQKTMGGLNMAHLSSEAGYSDQAHMCREVRRQTGFSPADLMRRIDEEEAFWSFRLLGERY